MSFVSFAQNFEDVVLWRALKHVHNGFYIDVGANDPNVDSVTKAFYDLGWHGINIEPLKEHWNSLEIERPRDMNLCCAAGDSMGLIDLWEPPVRGWATASPEIIAKYQADGHQGKLHTLPVRTLNDICSQYATGAIHFLKIDVEGFEAAVVRGLNFSKYRPWIVIVEALIPHSAKENYQEWEHFLLAANYGLAYVDGLNRFYVAAEHAYLKEKLRFPPNVLDDFVPAGQRQSEMYAANLKARVEHAESISAELNLRIQSAESNAEKLKVSVQRAELKVAQVQSRLAHSDSQVQAIFNSWSWRLTLPLRIVSGFLFNPRRTSRRLANNLLTRFISTFERPLALVMGGVLKYSNLRPILNKKLKQWPYMHAHLRSIAQRYDRIPQAFLAGHPKFNSAKRIYASDDFEFVEIPRYGKRARLLNSRLGTIYYYVDHTVLCPTNTGMQRVARQLARTLLDEGSRLVFVKWHNELERLVLITCDELHHLSQWGGPNLPASVIESDQYPADTAQPCVIEGDDLQDRNWLLVPEVTHINYHHRQLTLDIIQAAKRACLRTAFVFYDAIPLRRKELTAMASWHESYMRQLLHADLILPISEWSARDLQQFLTQHEGVSSAFLPAINPMLLPAEVYGQARTRNSEHQGENLILCVGSIDERKNQIQLARTFAKLVEAGLAHGWKLVFIGNLNPKLQEDFGKLVDDQSVIQWLGNCSDEILKAHYAKCAFTVFPSVEEGYGLPIAESLWFGKPSLCADFGPMAEIASGGGCLMVDMRSPEALREGLVRLISDKSLRDHLCSEALTRQLNDWKSYAGNFEQNLKDYSSSLFNLGKVYYLVDHTCSYEFNTGIQRVVRCLAAALIREGVQLIPAKWNFDKTELELPLSEDLIHLSKWNGPDIAEWAGWEEPGAKSAWLLMPELTSHYSAEEYKKIREYLDLRSLRACAIFYDTIPWKLRDIYPPQATQGHKQYMTGLNQFELILPISHYSRDQLELFYLGEPQATTGLQQRLIACPLPGEFLETDRCLKVKSLQAGPREILCVGTLEPRKNHLSLVRAFLLASNKAQRSMRLTLAGGGPFFEIAQEVRRLAAEHPEQIRWVESPTDEVLNNLYESCDFTVYSSIEEGFGLPILESLWHARPCICMNEGAMAEVATGGGCLMVDTRNIDALAEAILVLSQDDALYQRLSLEAIERPFRTWDDYASDCALLMAQERLLPSLTKWLVQPAAATLTYQYMPNLADRPLLSVCISTYNRASWLALSLGVLIKEAEGLRDKVEVFVCDNTSTDNTPDVMASYVEQGLVRYHRNPKNVGMLGNLSSTVQEARGKFIWILGDDDILKPGSIVNVLRAIEQNTDLSMVYLNYAYTRDESPKVKDHLKAFFDSATPVVSTCDDRVGPIKELAVLNENFFTAIYCVVFERSHALMAYSQFTEGEPFSNLPTCVPTTNHVLRRMMHLKGCWLGEPQLVINMNVSWLRFAWRWILERFPEMHDTAVKFGSSPNDVDRWRAHYLASVEHFFAEVFGERSEDALKAGFDTVKLITQIKHLKEYEGISLNLQQIYAHAHSARHPLALRPPESLFVKN